MAKQDLLSNTCLPPDLAAGPGACAMQQNFCVDLIEPDALISHALRELLAHLRMCISCYVDAEQFLASYMLTGAPFGAVPAVAEAPSHCLLLGSTLPSTAVPAIVQQLRRGGCSEPIIVLRPVGSDIDRAAALLAGANEVLEVAILRSFLLERLHERRTGRPSAPSKGNTRLRDGTCVNIRSIRPDDAEREQQFVRGLSASARHMRFFSSIKELSPSMLHTFTHPQFPSSVALVVTHIDQGQEVQIAVARYAPTDRPGVAEFAVVVGDAWQGFGLAGRLLRGLITAATVAGLDALEGMVLAENQRMRRFARALGFVSRRSLDDSSVVHVTRALRVVAELLPVANTGGSPGTPGSAGRPA